MQHRNNAEWGMRNAECQGKRRAATDLPLQFRTSHSAFRIYAAAPWHFLNFLPLPQGHGSLRPMSAYGLGATPAPTGDGWERSEERRVGKECRSRWSPYH